jgi:hypothetical protein
LFWINKRQVINRIEFLIIIFSQRPARRAGLASNITFEICILAKARRGGQDEKLKTQGGLLSVGSKE